MRSALAANKPCVILIVASMAGVVGQYACPLYCASKHAVVGFTKSMAQADVDENIKIVCILPGMVKTPLWTDQSVKPIADQFGYTDDICITPEQVAQAMVEMIESGEYPGGSLLQVDKGTMRGRLDSQQADKVMVASEDASLREWQERCFQPIREVFGRERGGKKGAKSVL
jgi:NAD(P)-dependent dehydrogenase (short-subunit alcohol dehydrogenase family)